jgi:DNA topoisomerase-1
MKKILFIVESPGKITKIQGFLGDKYVVAASYGHVRELDPSSMSIDIENDFTPIYKISSDKHKVVSNL